MNALSVTRANHLLTVQDRGRLGAMRYGVSQSGAMDWVRFSQAVALAGATAAFEVGVLGGALRASGRVGVAVAAPGFSVTIAPTSGEPRALEAPTRLMLDDGDTLTLSPGAHGMWAYVAVAGIDFGPPVLGSHATNARTGLGAHAFDRPFPVAQTPPLTPFDAADIDLGGGPIGLLPGPQHHLFDETVHAQMTKAPYRLTDQLDRMGYRLDGPPLTAQTHDIISDGIVLGAIQVPGNGQPIVLAADRAPTGGYPKIAVVAHADLPRLTQMRPGSDVRFQWLTLAEAEQRRRAITAQLSAPPRPRVRSDFSSEYLASRNLIDGVVAAAD
ncbi:MAG: biotin-dependent carboxyltransferase family protein [Acuticoccus sp.]